MPADELLYGQTPKREMETRIQRDTEQGVTLFYTIDWRLHKIEIDGDSEWPGNEETSKLPLDVYLPAETSFTFYLDEQGELHRDHGPAAVSSDDRCQEWWKHGVLHREDGPAVKTPNGWEEWYFDGEYHRDDGPAFVWPGNEQRWYRHGLPHRGVDANGETGPAFITADGTEKWFQLGQLHREPDPAGKEQPAVIRAGGGCEYYHRGRRHRESGPAVITDNGSEEYWLEDEHITEDEWRRRTSGQERR